MAKFVSPGVYTIEQDSSDFTPALSTATVGVVGFASKGPVNKATLITNQNQLIDTFGEPKETLAGQAIEGALEILEATDQLYFVRANGETAVEASALVQVGSCPAVQFSSLDIGTKRDLYLTVQVYDQDGNAQYDSPGKEFDILQNTITSGTAESLQAAALRKVIGGDLPSDNVGVFWDTTETNSDTSGYLVGAWAGSGAYLQVSAYGDSSRTLGVSCMAPVSANGLTVMATHAEDGHDAMGETDTGQSWPHAKWTGANGPGHFGLASSLTVYGATINASGTDSSDPGSETAASSLAYLVESLYPGAGYTRGTTLGGNTSGVEIVVEESGVEGNLLSVFDSGVARESYAVNLINSGVFIEDVINTGTTDPVSNYIQGRLMEGSGRVDPTATKVASFAQRFWTYWDADNGNLTTDPRDSKTSSRSWAAITQGRGLDDNIVQGVNSDGSGRSTADAMASGLTDVAGTVDQPSGVANPRFMKLVGGTYGMGDGTDGTMGTTQLKGDAASGTGVYALDDEALGIDVGLVPGIYTQEVQNALIDIAETTQSFLALVSPPEGIGTAQDAIDWSNGRSYNAGYVRTAAINSIYAAIYYPHVQVYNTFDGKNRFYDPAIYAARQICINDDVADPWAAPAGFIRGRLSKPTDVEYSLSQGERDAMYSGGNVINPVVNFAQQGITIFGQRTSQRSTSATNRINVRRMLIAIRKAILAGTRQYAFEPNDVFTWNKVKGSLDPYLSQIQRRRGITEFRVVCDETVNTPARVEKGELWTKIILKPTKTAEILVFEVNLTTQSAQLGTL